MGEEGENSGDERRTPQVSGCPPIRLKLSGSCECERGWMEEREHIGQEETAIGCDLYEAQDCLALPDAIQRWYLRVKNVLVKLREESRAKPQVRERYEW